VADEREKQIAAALARHDLPLALNLARQYRAASGVSLDCDVAGSSWFRAHYLGAQAALAGNLLGEAWECLRPLLARTAGLLPGLVCSSEWGKDRGLSSPARRFMRICSCSSAGWSTCAGGCRLRLIATTERENTPWAALLIR
jgi:hypothetical protein